MKSFLIIFFLIFSCKYFAQNNVHDIEILAEKQKTDQKNMVVFIHTNWCQYCKSMLNVTFKNSEIINLIKEKFHFVDLNAEEKRSIYFAGKTFNYEPTGTNTGIHQLAVSLGKIDGLVGYPTLIILNVEHQIIFQYNGFISAKTLLKILNQVS
jgi:thioredoxin-related protein